MSERYPKMCGPDMRRMHPAALSNKVCQDKPGEGLSRTTTVGRLARARRRVNDRHSPGTAGLAPTKHHHGMVPVGIVPWYYSTRKGLRGRWQQSAAAPSLPFQRLPSSRQAFSLT
jgi:hypothetical protein